MVCGKRWMKRSLLWRSVVWNFKLCEWVGNSVANWNSAAQRSTGTAELHLPGKNALGALWRTKFLLGTCFNRHLLY
jgi:hypothetical protein